MESQVVNRAAPTNFNAERSFLRIGLVAAGALLFRLAFDSILNASLARIPALVGLLVATTFLAILLLMAAGLNNPPSSLRWLVLGAFVTEVIIRSVISVQMSPAPDVVITDTGLYTDLAGELIQRGENPYTWDLSGAFDLYRTSMASSTPTLSGANETRFPYPPLTFFLVIPFQALGWPGVLSISILAHIALLILLFLASPRQVQPLVLVPLAAGFDFTFLALVSSMDIVWVVLLVAMVLAWRHPTVRAILFALAACTKQGPWLVLPFLLIRIWRDENHLGGMNGVVHFLIVAECGFLALNGVFIAWDPMAWLLGVSEPLRDDLVYYSQGSLSSLTQFGLAPLPKSFYLIATFVVFALLIFIYWRHYATLRDTFWILPGIFMWFSYRTLITYWLYWTLPLLVTLATRVRVPTMSRPVPKPHWAPTAAIGTGAFAGLVLFGVLGSTPPAIQVQPVFPVLINSDGHFAQMTVQVTNKSQLILTPRFALQGQSAGANAFPWYADSGPLALAPGQSATYQISAQRPDETFFVHDPVQVVVTDASGNYSLRGIAMIGPDRSYLWPDAIPNPSFQFWDMKRTSPIFWGLDTGPNQSGSDKLLTLDGKVALELAVNSVNGEAAHIALQSLILFPVEPFQIQIHPDYADPQFTYGLEFQDGQHRLRFLFGGENSVILLPDDTVEIRQSLPLHQWSEQIIDLRSVYSQIGWALPPLVHQVYRGLSADLRLVTVRLVFSVKGKPGSWQAYFGSITQPDYNPDPKGLMAETLDNPADYYVRIAQFYIRNRDYARALDAYRTALEFTPSYGPALDGIKSVQQQMAGEEQK